MTDFVITGTDTTARTLTDGEYGFVTEGSSLVVGGAAAITGTGANYVTLMGTVASIANFYAYDFDGTATDLVIGASGAVISPNSTALSLAASTSIDVSNHGSINGSVGIRATATDGTALVRVLNAGIITGVTGLDIFSGSIGTYIANSGTILTSSTSISLLNTTGQSFLTNSGIIETSGSKAVDFGTGNDTFSNAGHVTGDIRLGSGADFYDGTSGSVVGDIRGDEGNDTLLGGAASETLRGGTGRDSIHAGGGDDILFTNDSDYTSDTLNGGDGNDTVSYLGMDEGVVVNLVTRLGSSTSTGTDFLVSIENATGGNQGDLLIGDDGDNILDGSFGNDTLIGGLGADLMIGGEGTDTADYSDSAAGILVFLDGGISYGGARGDVFSGVEVLIGSNFSDTLAGSAGNDQFQGGTGNDTIYAGDGDDMLDGGTGADSLFGQDGDDTLFGSIGGDHLYGGVDTDTADYSNATSGVGLRLDGVANFGWATGDVFNSIENLIGGDFNDFLVGNGAGQRLEGGDGNDMIYANGGNDTLYGGDGNDVLYGQAGSDVFVFGFLFGDDTINGFDATDDNEDIDLSGTAYISSYGQLLLPGRMTQVGSDVVIDDLFGSTITLTGVNLADLDADDFIF